MLRRILFPGLPFSQNFQIHSQIMRNLALAGDYKAFNKETPKSHMRGRWGNPVLCGDGEQDLIASDGVTALWRRGAEVALCHLIVYFHF